jgi:hypothetical protein
MGVEDWVCCTILSGSPYSFAACFGFLYWRGEIVHRANLRDRRVRGRCMRFFIVSFPNNVPGSAQWFTASYD